MAMLDLDSENNAHRWKLYLQGIMWEPVLEKLVFTLKIPNNFYPSQDGGGAIIPMKMTFILWGQYSDSSSNILGEDMEGGRTLGGRGNVDL
jgi:hypothetical protein